jgi:hypothetical protein
MSPFIAAELRQLAGSAVQNMELATGEFEAKHGRGAIQYQVGAMSDLNRTFTRLMESLDELQQCQNGSNCDQGIPKLESLCRKQGQLNQKSQGMCKNPGAGGQPKPGEEGRQMREQMGRLAAEQGAIRKSLQELEQEFGGSRQILGRLSDIAKEMETVEEAFQNGTAGEETAARQLKIYSRMLEATRSLQRKDFTERRKAASATESPIWIPEALPRELLDDRMELEDRLRQFLGEGYPPQYEEQIKAYFRALLRARSVGGGAAQPTGSGQ